MDKQTLSQYGWIVVAILVLTVMIALATPFGKYIEQGVQNTVQGLFDTEQKALGAAGMVIQDAYIDQTNEANILYDRVYESVETNAAGIWHRDGSITLYHDALGATFSIPASDVIIEGNTVSHTDPVCPTERQYYHVDWDSKTIYAETYGYTDYNETTGVFDNRFSHNNSTPTKLTEFTSIEDWLSEK